MPISPYPVKKLFYIEATLQIIVTPSGLLKPQMGTDKQLTKSINVGLRCCCNGKLFNMIQKRSFRTHGEIK